MPPITRSRARRQRRRHTPYNLPPEIMGNIYRYTVAPREFGAVNSVFRSVQNDPHFERNRKLQIISDAIVRNNGSRIFSPRNYPAQLNDLVLFQKTGCILSTYDGSCLKFWYGDNIKRIEIKALIGLKTITNNRFVPIGSYPLLNESAERPISETPLVIETTALTGQFFIDLEQDNPRLRADLLKVMNKDLRNPTQDFLTFGRHPLDGKHDYNEKRRKSIKALLQRVGELQRDATLLMSIEVMDKLLSPTWPMPGFHRANLKVVDNTLEVSIPYELRYRGNIYDPISGNY